MSQPPRDADVFRVKITVRAVKWRGPEDTEQTRALDIWCGNPGVYLVSGNEYGPYSIHPGDWLVWGRGSDRPIVMTPEAFAATYEPAPSASRGAGA